MRPIRQLAILTALAAFAAMPAVAAKVYELDPAHSSIGFSVRHFGLSNVKGSFSDWSLTLGVDEENLADSSVNVTIQAASITTGNEQRDNHLRSPDFFAVEEFPTLTFESTSIEKTDDGFRMTGDLTMHGQTHEVSFPFEVFGPLDTGRGKRLGAEGSLTIDRQKWGISWSRTLDTGGLVVANEVKIDFSIEAVVREEEAAE